MNGVVKGMIKFTSNWSRFYQSEIPVKLAKEYTDQQAMRAHLLSINGPYRAITNIESGVAFYAAAQSAIRNNTGAFSSASFVNQELNEMIQSGVLMDIDLTSYERKKIKQRIQSKQLALMKTLEHFDLFKIEVRKGSLSNNVNYYVITDKGRHLHESLSQLELEGD